MRRKEREQGTEFIHQVMDSCVYMVLSMTGVDGLPYSVPLTPVRSGEDIYFHCAPEGEKVDALRALSGDSPDSAVSTAQEIVGLYRQRARELCQACYQVTGQMPDFEAALSQGEPVG